MPAISLLALFLLNCSSNSANQIQVSVGQRATLSVGQTAVINNEDLSFRFIQVNGDSRCPSGVQCIRAGDAKCDMQFVHNNITSEITLDDTGGAQGYSQSSFDQYNLSFRVDPYPEYGKTVAANDYKLLITVTKKYSNKFLQGDTLYQ